MKLRQHTLMENANHLYAIIYRSIEYPVSTY